MSRIGRKPVEIPSGVSVDRIEGGLRVKGPHGTTTERMPARGRPVTVKPSIVT